MKALISSVICVGLVLQGYTAAFGQSSDSKPAVVQETSPSPTKASPAPNGPTLEDATPVKLRIARTVSSADAKTGDTVDFEVLEEVSVGNVVVIPKGGVAWATVTDAQPKRRMARGGKLNMNIDAVRLSNGQKVALRAVKEVKGGGHTGAMTGAMVATGIVFFPAAPLFLFMHGKDITIPKGTEITAYINGNTPLDMASFPQSTQDASAVDSTLPATSAKSPELSGKATITSQPPGADIELDGNFVGNTPSVLSLNRGEHVIVVKKTGFKDWQRKISFSGGDINLSPELEKQE